MSNVCSMHGDLNLLAATVLSSVHVHPRTLGARSGEGAYIRALPFDKMAAADSLVWPY